VGAVVTLREALVPVVLGDRELLRAAIERAWTQGRGKAYADVDQVRDEIREALAAYQAERAEIDAEIAADGA
jgi:hypothetical protein